MSYSRIVILSLLFFSVSYSTTFGQSSTTNIYSWLQPGIIELPQDEIGVPLDSIDVIDAYLYELLDDYGVELVSTTFPNYDPTDTIDLNPAGQNVGKPDFSHVFTFVFSDTSDLQLIVDDLLLLEGIVRYAEVASLDEYFLETNDDSFPKQWHLHNTGQAGGTPGADINAKAGWDIYAVRLTRFSGAFRFLG